MPFPVSALNNLYSIALLEKVDGGRRVNKSGNKSVPVLFQFKEDINQWKKVSSEKLNNIFRNKQLHYLFKKIPKFHCWKLSISFFFIFPFSVIVMLLQVCEFPATSVGMSLAQSKVVVNGSRVYIFGQEKPSNSSIALVFELIMCIVV